MGKPSPVTFHRRLSKKTPQALNGSIATPGADYQPFAQAPVPAQGDLFHIWVHYRKAALQMKTRINGNLKAFDWNWDKQLAGFDWRKVGTFTRTALGDSILFITPAQHSARWRNRRNRDYR